MISDATIAAANQAIKQVFETTSLAWRTIPHWETGDRAQSAVRADTVETLAGPQTSGPFGAAAEPVIEINRDLTITHAQSTDPNPDEVVAGAQRIAVDVVQEFDRQVAERLMRPAITLGTPPHYAEVGLPFGTPPPPYIPGTLPPTPPVDALIDARTTFELAGYHSPRCVWAGLPYFKGFHAARGTRIVLGGAASVLEMSAIYHLKAADFAPGSAAQTAVETAQGILDAAEAAVELAADDVRQAQITLVDAEMLVALLLVGGADPAEVAEAEAARDAATDDLADKENALADDVTDADQPRIDLANAKVASLVGAGPVSLLIARRNVIPAGRAFEAAAGPEPIDLAISAAPSLEIIGNNPGGQIELAVRMRYALRFKDERAVVVWHT